MRKIFILLLIIGAFIFIVRAGIEFLNPEYWNPKSFIDYLAVILTSFQEILFALILFTMLKLEPVRKELNWMVWGLAISVAGVGSFVAGIGNFFEDAMRLTPIGNLMFSYGGMTGGMGLTIAFVVSLSISEVRKYWSWFYLLPLIGVILFSDFGGFISGIAMLILSGIEMRNRMSQ